MIAHHLGAQRRCSVRLSAGVLTLVAGAAAWAGDSAQCLFYPHGAVPVSQSPRAIAAGDLGESAFDHIVTISPSGNLLSILETPGPGESYFERATIPVPPNTTGVVIADVTNDGLDDIVYLTESNATLTLLARTGEITFAGPVTVPVGATPTDLTAFAHSLAFGDEIAVVCTDGSIRVFGGALLAPIVSVTLDIGANPGRGLIVAGDFFGTGTPDSGLVVSFSQIAELNRISIQKGMLVPASFNVAPPSFRHTALAAGNLDGDGATDIVFAGTNLGSNLWGTVVNIPNPVVNSDSAGPAPVVDAIVGQFTDDTNADFVLLTDAGTDNGVAELYLGAGNGDNIDNIPNPVQRGPVAMVRLDADADGDDDFAVANAISSSVSIVLGNSPLGDPDVPLAFDAALGAGTSPSASAVGDFNGDGLLDIATTNRSSNNVSVRIATAPGRYGPERRFSVGIRPTGIAAGRLDPDTRDDLIVSNELTDNVSVLRWNAAGQTFFPATSVAVGDGPSDVVLGDFDNDGDLDAAVSLRNANSVRLLINNSGVFNPGDSAGTGGDPVRLAVGELTGTAGLDIAVACAGNGSASIIVGDNAGQIELTTNVIAAFFEVVDVAVADVDLDMIDDVLILSAAPPTLQVARGLGNEMFDELRSTFLPNTASSLAVGEIDGRLGVDVVVGTTDSRFQVLLSPQGTPFFLAQSVRVTGNNGGMRDVVLADLNNDGVDDVVATLSGVNQTAVALNIDRDGPAETVLSAAPTILPPGTIVEGTAVSISAPPFGQEIASFQWLRNGVPVSGDPFDQTQSPVLLISPASPNESGTYTIRGTNACGDAFISLPVELVVLVDPDRDDDGIPNQFDNCPDVFNPDQADDDNDGIGDRCEIVDDTDFDNDGTPDNTDNCPAFANADQSDIDGDGRGDACDNCPETANPNQADSNNDFVGDACTTNDDTDGDGVPNSQDNCPDVANELQEDADKDGVGDACDNCPDVSNPDQDPSACVTDSDKDGVPDDMDNCPFIANADQTDDDDDGRGNPCDNCPIVSNDQTDTDTDGVGDVCDNCPTVANPDQTDLLGCTLTEQARGDVTNGIGDACECDGDANRDGQITFADITTVLANFGTVWYECPGTCTDAGRCQGDANRDGFVSFLDITTVLANFGLSCTSTPVGR
jgi:hypothetical protein